MVISRLQLWNFRNYEQLDLQLSPGVSILSGENGQGKTNVLEAVHLLSTGRSHRTVREKDMILHTASWARARLEISQRDGKHTIDFLLSRSEKKKILVNGLAINRIGEMLGQLSCVLFSPEDLFLVKQGPQERRRFMDIELSQVSRSYFYALGEYNKTLEQRNSLLKELGQSKKANETLSVWDQILAEKAIPILRARKRFCDRLAPLVTKNHLSLSGGKEQLFCIYQGCSEKETPKEQLEDFLRQLEQKRETDLRRGFTGIGPHKDDLVIKLGETDLRYFGSQGQQRTATLALKLSELELMKEDIGEYPVLLLDDVFSELDMDRQRLLLSRIGGIQTLVTTAQPVDELFKDLHPVLLQVKAGRIFS